MRKKKNQSNNKHLLANLCGNDGQPGMSWRLYFGVKRLIASGIVISLGLFTSQ